MEHCILFQVAKSVASACVDLLSEMDSASASLLLSFLAHSRCTCVFEVLQPSYQHVVDLSHLSRPQLNFICWTTPYEEKSAKNSESHCAVAPDAALDFMASLGAVAVQYEVYMGFHHFSALIDALFWDAYSSRVRVFFRPHIVRILPQPFD